MASAEEEQEKREWKKLTFVDSLTDAQKDQINPQIKELLNETYSQLSDEYYYREFLQREILCDISSFEGLCRDGKRLYRDLKEIATEVVAQYQSRGEPTKESVRKTREGEEILTNDSESSTPFHSPPEEEVVEGYRPANSRSGFITPRTPTKNPRFRQEGPPGSVYTGDSEVYFRRNPMATTTATITEEGVATTSHQGQNQAGSGIEAIDSNVKGHAQRLHPVGQGRDLNQNTPTSGEQGNKDRNEPPSVARRLSFMGSWGIGGNNAAAHTVNAQIPAPSQASGKTQPSFQSTAGLQPNQLAAPQPQPPAAQTTASFRPSRLGRRSASPSLGTPSQPSFPPRQGYATNWGRSTPVSAGNPTGPPGPPPPGPSQSTGGSGAHQGGQGGGTVPSSGAAGGGPPGGGPPGGGPSGGFSGWGMPMGGWGPPAGGPPPPPPGAGGPPPPPPPGPPGGGPPNPYGYYPYFPSPYMMPGMGFENSKKWPELSKTDSKSWTIFRNTFLARCCQYNVDDRRFRFELFGAMKDEAAVSVANIDILAGTKEELLEKYENIFMTPSGSELAEAEFYQAKQLPDESLLAWHARAREHFQRAFPHNDVDGEEGKLLRKIFIMGLHTRKIGEYVYDKRDTNYQNCLHHAQDKAAAMAVFNERSQKLGIRAMGVGSGAREGENMSINQISGACYICKEEGHLQRDCPVAARAKELLEKEKKDGVNQIKAEDNKKKKRPRWVYKKGKNKDKEPKVSQVSMVEAGKGTGSEASTFDDTTKGNSA